MQFRSSNLKDVDAKSEVMLTPGAPGTDEALAAYADQEPIEDPRSLRSRRCRPRRRVYVVGALVLVAILCVTLAVKKDSKKDASTEEWSPPTRVRRSWKTYTEEDKTLYLSAVQLAMEKGYHYRFVQIHTHEMNRITSHGACPFLLWHRRFILGYENMLRSLAPEYANITLPYWNYFEDTNRQLASSVLCNSLEGCSQFLRDMGGGGTSDGPTGQNMTIEHIELDIGSCVSKGIAGHACNHPNGTASGRCANCILRGNWSSPRRIVQTLGTDLLSVLDVFNASKEEEAFEGAHAVLSHEVERTFHNAIHNTLNSTMRYTSSAFDPVFMGHHGMVDLAQLIFNRCKYVPDPTVKINWKKEKRDPRFDVFTACDVENDRRYNYTAFGNETMQMDMYTVPVAEDPVMKQFFNGFGNRYEDVANAEDLGPDNSYTYAIDPYLQQLLESHNVQCPEYLYEANAVTSQRRLELSWDDDRDRQLALELVSTLSSCGREIASRYPKMSYRQQIEQEGLVKCLVVEDKAGGSLDDYDEAFRSMMQMDPKDSPYCVKLLRRYRAGDLPLLASDDCLQKYGALTGVDLAIKISLSTNA